MKLWKISGTLLVATGILHTLVAAAMAGNTYLEIAREGLFVGTGENLERNFALWFLVCGVLVMLWGATMQYYIRKQGQPAPEFIGWALVAFSLIGGMIEPISGFWLFLPQGIIILLANRKQQQTPEGD